MGRFCEAKAAKMTDAKGNKVLVCDNGTGVSLSLMPRGVRSLVSGWLKTLVFNLNP